MVLAFRSYEKEPKQAPASQPETTQPDAARGATLKEGATPTEGVMAAQETTMRAGAVRNEAANDRRVGERRMTPAGQH